ncbi:hypothetical protein D9M70_643670 [compost metagenome]
MATTLTPTATSIDTRITTLGWSSCCARSRVRWASKVSASHQLSTWYTATPAHQPASARAVRPIGQGTSATATAAAAP